VQVGGDAGGFGGGGDGGGGGSSQIEALGIMNRHWLLPAHVACIATARSSCALVFSQFAPQTAELMCTVGNP